MTFSRRKTALGLSAGVAILALTVAGCSSSDDPEPSTSATGGAMESTSPDANAEPVTLTLATFNTPGYNSIEQPDANYEYDLIQEYMDANPNVTITYDRKAESGDARTNFFAKLGPGGLADVEMVEVDWMPEVMQYSDLLADLTDPSLDGRWLDSKVADATDQDGRLIGAGTDVGPQAVCYRSSLFEEAGLASDPDGVADLLDGDWANFFDVGQKYFDATGKAFFDSTGGIWQGMINQIDPAYEDADSGDIIALDNPEVKAAYDQLTVASKDQSTHLGQWSEDWFAGMQNDAFAVMLCPPWMLGVISGSAADATDWNIANVYPNGGGNWGGSWLTVPANGANVDEAKKLADWLTAPEQQAKAFANAGTYPSQPAAYEDPLVASASNAFFNDAATGTIFADRAQAVLPSPYKGTYYFQVNTAITDALTRVDDGTDAPDASWDKAVTDINNIG
ncbi:ABC transporter substrate-binding protein [Demequina aurantiaca]|uniref:ABC transporter substrate-binding protein n=1 Tax=Demequina aurantiaca TaxID=676200 RepID=UPI000A7F4A97|nr:ABC transporter substrate-binding protein [Demequina aurantiaca]